MSGWSIPWMWEHLPVLGILSRGKYPSRLTCLQAVWTQLCLLSMTTLNTLIRCSGLRFNIHAMSSKREYTSWSDSLWHLPLSQSVWPGRRKLKYLPQLERKLSSTPNRYIYCRLIELLDLLLSWLFLWEVLRLLRRQLITLMGVWWRTAEITRIGIPFINKYQHIVRKETLVVLNYIEPSTMARFALAYLEALHNM